MNIMDIVCNLKRFDIVKIYNESMFNFMTSEINLLILDIKDTEILLCNLSTSTLYTVPRSNLCNCLKSVEFSIDRKDGWSTFIELNIKKINSMGEMFKVVGIFFDIKDANKSIKDSNNTASVIYVSGDEKIIIVANNTPVKE